MAAVVKQEAPSLQMRLLPVAVVAGAVAAWAFFASLKLVPESTFPSPAAVFFGFGEEIRTGRLSNDLVASLWRVVLKVKSLSVQ